MKLFSGLLFCVCLSVSAAQQPADEREVAAAKAEIAKLRVLLEAGAVSRNQLAKAEESLSDAEDSALLRRTAFGQDLSVEQADEMIAAAQRRVDRRQASLDATAPLIQAGVANPRTIESLKDDLDRSRKEFDLAEDRARVTRELHENALAEQAAANHPDTSSAIDSAEGDGVMAYATFAKVEVAFEQHFGKKMPVSAMGETAVHRAMGFDHRGRVDVAIYPDDPEGVWLIDYLKGNHIPYFAFRAAVPGKATGAHIHIGPGSTRLVSGG